MKEKQSLQKQFSQKDLNLEVDSKNSLFEESFQTLNRPTNPNKKLAKKIRPERTFRINLARFNVKFKRELKPLQMKKDPV